MRQITCSFFYTFLFFLLSFIPEFAFSASPITSHTPIKIGMSTALSGPAAALGQEMKAGIECYFSKVNAAGGIAGRPLMLISKDDGYEPQRAASNVRALIDQDDVLAFIGNVGTPTAVTVIPIVNKSKVLLFAPFTGAGILRNVPPDRYVINFRASYAEETASIIKGLLQIGIKPEKIAFFTQNDAYGDSGYQGAIEALKASSYEDAEKLPYGRYERNTSNVEEGLSEIIAARTSPQAFIIVGAYAPVAKFIKLAKQIYPNALFLNVSFVGSMALADALGKKDGDNVIVTQVVPPLDSNLPAVAAYRADLKQCQKSVIQYTFGSLEGYLSAVLFVKGLEKAAAQNNLTREGIIDAFESMHDVDIGIGAKIFFDKKNHQALHTIWPTEIKNGKFVPLNWAAVVVK